MKKIILIRLLAGLMAAPALAGQVGCVETSTVTIEAQTCLQLECTERSELGFCTLWDCTKTQKKEYADTSSSGCTRFVDCGLGFEFTAGAPGGAETESLEICEWNACVEANSKTGSCTDHRCVSRRTIETKRVKYPEARCVKKAPQGETPVLPQSEATQPFTAQPIRRLLPSGRVQD